MKNYIYKTLTLLFTLLLTSYASAQCPFTANITTTDAGGCGNMNGSVFFSVQETDPGSISGTFYRVYQADGTTLINSLTNVNPEISLQAGTYVAEVQVQCADATAQSVWRSNFTIASTTAANDFTLTQDIPSTINESLSVIPTGVLAYELTSSNALKYTVDIIAYPTAYTGAIHFENIDKGTYLLEELPAGDYTVRITNGCKVITNGPRKIVQAAQDIPLLANGFIDALVRWNTRNTRGNGIMAIMPTTDYSTLYLMTTISSSPPIAWNQQREKYYEYAFVYESDGESINSSTHWYPMSTSTEKNKATMKYTIGEFVKDKAKQPTVYFRVKGTSVMASSSSKPPIASSGQQYYLKNSDTTCGTLDFRLQLAQSSMTYPLTIELRESDKGPAVGTYVVTEADLKSYNGFTIVIPGLTEAASGSYYIYGVSTTDPQEYYIETINRQNILNMSIASVTTGATTACNESNGYPQLKSAANLDLRGATATYKSGPPLRSDIKTSFTIPADHYQKITTVDLFQKIGGTFPSDIISIVPPGIYKWDISFPCGNTQKDYEVSYTVANRNYPIIDKNKFKPKTVSSPSVCGSVEIEVGDIADLKSMAVVATRPTRMHFSIYKKNDVGTANENYSALGNTAGVHYDGSTNSVNSDGTYTDDKPKIRIFNPGEYYLIGSIVNIAGWGTVIYTDPSNLNYSSEDCYVIKKFEITSGDLEAELDLDVTGAYFCSTTHSSGHIFVTRKGSNTGNSVKFKVWNDDLTFNKEVTTDAAEVLFENVDVATYGNRFNVSVEAAGNCTSSPSVATLIMSEIGNSTAFISQSVDADCDQLFEIEVEAYPFIGSTFVWKDKDGNVLSRDHKLKDWFYTGDKLYLEVIFSYTGPNNVVTSCNSWTTEYTVKGSGSPILYWRYSAQTSNWDSRYNWYDETGAIAQYKPGPCSCVNIPSTISGSSLYPDLAGAVNPEAKEIIFSFGGQLYNQHLLKYTNAFVSYDFGYYQDLTAIPSVLTQPTHSVNQYTASVPPNNSIAFSSLPVLKRANWYMLAAPLKGMLSGDLQMAGQPFTFQRFYKEDSSDSENFVKDGVTVAPTNNIALSDNYNAVSLWVSPFANYTGADDQTVAEAIWGNISYPYFAPAVMSDTTLIKYSDRVFNETTSIMTINQFKIEDLTSSASNTVTRSKKAGRFIYEEDLSNAIPASQIYQVAVVADAKRTTGKVMIGNPFMAPLDFELFRQANAAVIKNIYYLDVNGNQISYDMANPTASTLTKYIAAQQAFIIVLNSPTAAATINFSISSMAVQSSATTKVKPL